MIRDVLNPEQTASAVFELTASGRGAICVLWVTGQELPRVLGPSFRSFSGVPLPDQPWNKPVYGHWNDEDIIVLMHGVNNVEIHCHGGDMASRRILQDLASLGFPLRQPQELLQSGNWAQRSLGPLARATTEKSAAVLAWQARGALDQALLGIEDAMQAQQYAAAKQQIHELLQWESLGRRLDQPWKVVIAGAPNAGKSSLINAIVGYSRSIVFNVPGTTRDLVTVETAIGGWPVELTDTAGLRESADEIESLGIALAGQAIDAADLIVEVIDLTDPAPVRLVPENEDHLVVWNKADLVSSDMKIDGLRVSALQGEGLNELLDQIATRLVPREPQPGTAVPFDALAIRWLKDRLAEIESKQG